MGTVRYTKQLQPDCSVARYHSNFSNGGKLTRKTSGKFCESWKHWTRKEKNEILKDLAKNDYFKVRKRYKVFRLIQLSVKILLSTTFRNYKLRP